MEFNTFISMRKSYLITGLNKNIILRGINTGCVDAFVKRGRYFVNVYDLIEYCYLIHSGKIDISPLVKLYPMRTIEHFCLQLVKFQK